MELFTHPICSGCQEAFDALSKLAQAGRVSLEVCDLGTARGRRRADAVGVMNVPTVSLNGRFEELMGRDDLARVLAEIGS